MISEGLRLGIDGSNLRSGGGVTHLVEFLAVADPQAHGFSHVIVWSGPATLGRIADRPWLVKRQPAALAKGLLHRTLWQRFALAREARAAGCDVLFVPGGSYAGSFHPMVTMSRNMLPFEWTELRRLGLSVEAAKMLVLRRAQTASLRRAEGVIFLTQYARDAVMRVVGRHGPTRIIPHGTAEIAWEPREQQPIERYSTDRPLRLLYVSSVHLYKHQWHVADAVASLRRSGRPVELELVGAAYPPALARLRSVMSRVDPGGAFIHYAGALPQAELAARYAAADVCIFASSCENMPNILLEAMAHGLPIACADRGPMREVLGDAGVYLDPEQPHDVARAVNVLIDAPGLRHELGRKARERASAYSWTRCAAETLGFIREVADR